jgi:calcineurin-like phosphoesterase
MRVLILGDVVGRPARRAIRDLVPSLIEREGIDLAIANAENAAGGIGVDLKSANELLSSRVDVLTSGNHIWKKKEIYQYLDEHSDLIRPANYPEGAPGRGWCAWQNEGGLRALVINVQGRVFMPNHVDDPFRSVDSVIGMDKETVIKGFLSQLPRHFEVAHENVVLQGIIVDVDEDSGQAREIRRLRIPWQPIQ